MKKLIRAMTDFAHTRENEYFWLNLEILFGHEKVNSCEYWLRLHEGKLIFLAYFGAVPFHHEKVSSFGAGHGHGSKRIVPKTLKILNKILFSHRCHRNK